jgi:hypothetical protein
MQASHGPDARVTLPRADRRVPHFAIAQFADKHEIHILNVAGPRSSGWTQGYSFAVGVVGDLIAKNIE